MKKTGGLILAMAIMTFVGFLWFRSTQRPQTTPGSAATLLRQATAPAAVPLPPDLRGEIVFQSDRDGNAEIYLLELKGGRLGRLTRNTAFDGYPVWSPDGKKIAFESNRDGAFHIYTMDRDGNQVTKITSGPGPNRFPAWSPDAKKIAFESTREKDSEIYQIEVDSRLESRLTDGWFKSTLPNWSPDGRKIAFTANKLGWGVYLLDLGDRTIKMLDNEGGSCRPHFSPDGKKMAFVSQKADGKGDIWVMNSDGTNKTQITRNRETYEYYPTWSPDGRYLAYSTTSDKKQGHWKIQVIPSGGGTPIQITHHPVRDEYPDWRWR
jgi:Tol biopolymer transport system component